MSYHHTTELMEVMGKVTLSATAKLVLISLTHRANNSRECWPSIPTIAKDLGISQQTAERNIATLRKTGFIKVRKMKQYGRITNRYKIAPPSAVMIHTQQKQGVTPPTDEGNPPSELGFKPVSEPVREPVREPSDCVAIPPLEDLEDLEGVEEEEEEMKGKTLDEIMNEEKKKTQNLKTISLEEYAQSCLNKQGTLTGDGLRKIWGLLLFQQGYVQTMPSLTMKDQNQLKQIKSKFCFGSDAAVVQVLESCLTDWKGFTKRVQSENQLPDHPKVPQIWYVLKHGEVAKAFTVGAEKVTTPKGDSLKESKVKKLKAGKFDYLDPEDLAALKADLGVE